MSGEFPYTDENNRKEEIEDHTSEVMFAMEFETSISIDNVDANPVYVDDENLDSVDRIPSHLSSMSAGDFLLNPGDFSNQTDNNKVTGGDIVEQFDPRKDDKRDSVISLDEVFEKEPVVFKEQCASDSVKHFFSDYLAPDSFVSDDVVDAGPPSDDGEDSNPVNASDVGPGTPPDPDDPHMAVLKGAQASKTCSSEAEYRYNMNHPERGCFVIFNQRKFDLYNKLRHKSHHLNDRVGTNKDAANLEHMARVLGFEYVRIIQDETRENIVQWVKNLSRADHSNYDCFACAILTHGGGDDVLYARDEQMHITDFTRPFGADNCRSLAMKPKLFFIQACRGHKLGSAVRLLNNVRSPDSVDGRSGNDTTDGPPEITIPAEADFLIANSTVPDYYSWRNETNGSWFVESLCATMKACGNRMEIMQVMTRVNRMVAYDYESAAFDPKFDNKKQIPSIATRLTREVYFPRKKVYAEVPAANEVASTSLAKQTTTTTIQLRTERQMDSQGYHTEGSFQECISTTTIKNSNQGYAGYQQNRAFSQTSDKPPPLPPKRGLYPKQKTPQQRKGQPPNNQYHCTPRSDDALSPKQSDGFSFQTSTPISMPVVIPGSPESQQGCSRSLDSPGLHKSQTVPTTFPSLRETKSSRFSDHRLSLPQLNETRRIVKQETDDILVVGGRKTNKSYEESDV